MKEKFEQLLHMVERKRATDVHFTLMQHMEVVDNASDENNENTRRKATVVPIKIEYV